MTNVPEVVLAREAGLCYGALAMVSNLACGLSPTPLSHDEVRSVLLAGSDSLARVLNQAIESIPVSRDCACAANTGLVL